MNSNQECFTIGFHSQEGKRIPEHFNFETNESRNNVVVCPAVLKLKHNGDNKAVNFYQKLRKLLDWEVSHFSHIGYDIYSCLGTGLAASLALGRHCVAVEINERQSSVLRGRVLNLVDNREEDDGTKGADNDGEEDEERQLDGDQVSLDDITPLD